jgi:nitrite reductase/ring-hydroxylating ferredoxin subunit
VYRNQIGLDIRYADAGKWTEQSFESNSGKIAVAGSDELKVNQMKLLRFSDKRLVLCRTEKGYHVIDDRCTHRGGSLAGGAMICGIVQCPWHGSQFDVQSGTVKAGPAKEQILSYPVSESEGKVFVILN